MSSSIWEYAHLGFSFFISLFTVKRNSSHWESLYSHDQLAELEMCGPTVTCSTYGKSYFKTFFYLGQA